MPPRTFNQTFTIGPTDAVGTDPQYSDPVELPPLSVNAEMTCAVTLSALAGGTAPTVSSTLQASNDGSSWTDISIVSEANGALSQSANGATAWHADANGIATIPVPQVRYLRLKSTGGGTAPPTAWTTTAKLRIGYDG